MPPSIGLTATPSKQTFGFFNQNLVMEYNHDEAVADGVNVGFRRLPHPYRDHRARGSNGRGRLLRGQTRPADPRGPLCEKLDDRPDL